MLVSLSNAFLNKRNLKKVTAYSQSFLAEDVTDEHFIEHITSGYAFTPAIFEKNYRKSENFIQAQIIGLDFDQGVSVAKLSESALNSLIWMIYATPSSTKDHPKSRAIIKLNQPIKNGSDYEKVVTALHLIFADLKPDKAASDCARYFYGSDTSDYKLLGNVISIEQIKTVLEGLQSPKEKEKTEPYKPKMEYKRVGNFSYGNGTPTSFELRHVLSQIPPEKEFLTYDEWCNVLMAIHYCYQNDKGLQIAKEWTEHCSQPNEIENKWKSFSVDKEKPVTAATIYGIRNRLNEVRNKK